MTKSILDLIAPWGSSGFPKRIWAAAVCTLHEFGGGKLRRAWNSQPLCGWGPGYIARCMGGSGAAPRRPLAAARRAGRTPPAIRHPFPHCHYHVLIVHLPLSSTRNTNSFSLSPDTRRATSDFGGCSSSIAMDPMSIPDFALHRQSTTVIVRMKDVKPVASCCHPEECPVQDFPKDRHRPSGCEQCTRTRLIRQYSDCDSGIVEKCRPYKSRAARSSKHFIYLFIL